jgi:hypothetical protein
MSSSGVAGMPVNGPSIPVSGGPMPGQMGMQGPGGIGGQPSNMQGLPGANTGLPNNQRMPGPGGIKGAQAAADAALQAAANLAGRQPFNRSPGMGQHSPRMFTPQQQSMNFNSTSQNSGVNQVMPNHMSGGQMHTLNQLQAQVNSVDSGSRPTPSTTPVPNSMSVSSCGSPLTSHMEHSGGENSNSGDAQGSMSGEFHQLGLCLYEIQAYIRKRFVANFGTLQYCCDMVLHKGQVETFFQFLPNFRCKFV